MSKLLIRNGTIEEVSELSRLLPEFDNPHPPEAYRERMAGKTFQILIAEYDGTPAGFKVGYDKFGNSSEFYSWMGGVLPQFRKKGIAKALAIEQEKRAAQSGFASIVFKTRNRHKAMLLFAVGRGFDIIGFEPKPTIEEHRILLKKKL